MSEFILRIFFSGLMAFAPSPDGKQLTVLVVNTSHNMQLSDNTSMPHHLPMLLVRAGTCEPAPCPAGDAAIANRLFPMAPASKGTDQLAHVLGGGAAWELSGSDLSLVPAAPAPLAIRTSARKSWAPIPMSPAERADFSWVPRLSAIVPGIGEVRPELLGEHPPSSVLAARLRLSSGSVTTYSMVRVDGMVRPIHFRTGENTQDVPYAQGVANWVMVEIHVPGDSIEIVDTNFNTGAKRTMKFHPQNGLVEMALLNLPPFDPPAAGAKLPLPKPGRHFEVYYDLMTRAPAKDKRPVPHLPKDLRVGADPQVEWLALHPKSEASPLIEELGLSARGNRRAPYDLVLCPGSQIP